MKDLRLVGIAVCFVVMMEAIGSYPNIVSPTNRARS